VRSIGILCWSKSSCNQGVLEGSHATGLAHYSPLSNEYRNQLNISIQQYIDAITIILLLMLGQCVGFYRRATAQTFRKSLVMDFKLGKKDTHKNPHSLPMNTKQQLLKKKRGGDWDRIRELQQ